MSEQLLLSEGVCRQVKILAYHPDVLGKGSSHSARARDSNPPMQFLRVVYHSRRRRPYHMSLLTVVLTRLVDPWAPFFRLPPLVSFWRVFPSIFLVTPTCVVLPSVPTSPSLLGLTTLGPWCPAALGYMAKLSVLSRGGG